LKRAFVGALVESGVVVAMLAPFMLAGSFRIFQHEWRVATGTLLGLVVTPGTHFGWPLRLLQAALALSAGAAVALVLRRSIHALWLAPLAVVIVRLVLDPLSFGWYFLEAVSLVLVGAGLLLTELPERFPQARLAVVGRQPRDAAPPPARS
ncbi:MAG: hypothetical protein QOG93_2433, partial [Gaiellaceae bacterium]|nr:hypothetical protein [Gaiellaceae bacterium]